MSEQPQEDGVRVEFADILSGVHDSYQERERSLIENLAVQRGAMKQVQQQLSEAQQIVNALNEEVRALRGSDVKGDGLVQDAATVPPAPAGRKVRDVPQA